MNNEITQANHCKITCSDSRKRHFYLVNWRRDTKFSEIKNIQFTRHYSSLENEFWTKFKRLLMTSISIRIKTFRIIAFNKVTHSINKVSYAIHRILFAINSEIITSRTFDATRYSRNAAITHKIISSIVNQTFISWIMNSEKFSETILFIFISIRSSRNLRNIRKPLQRKFIQWFIIISVEKSLYSSFRKEVNSQTIISIITFSEILSIISIAWAIL
jgi:hypothetical protein